MGRYQVTIGQPGGGDGQSLTVRASSELEAKAQVLESDTMIENPSWEILAVDRL